MAFKYFLGWLFWFDWEFTCLTCTSKNAFTPRDQNPPTFISNLASSLVFADLKEKVSLSSGIVCGSLSTFLHTFERHRTSKSFTLSCLWVTKPPFLQHKAWSTEKFCSHAHFCGRSFRRILYLRRMASLNSSLFRLKPCSSNGITFSHELAPLSRVCSTCISVSAGRA